MKNHIKIGVSACLLGENVRYDGGHKRDRYLTDVLSDYFDYVPVCPEVECGLPVPRESMRLTGDPQAPRLTTNRTKRDLTEQMQAWARPKVAELEKENLCGFIFKSNSPSSGMERVKVYSDSGMAEKTGVGLFARIFMDHFPDLPCEEEGRLNDSALRENFIERVFALHAWKESVLQTPTRKGLSDFQARMKLSLMAHSPRGATALGRIAARGKDSDLSADIAEYGTMLMTVMRLIATPKKHTNVLHHAMGYFKKMITADEKVELLDVIESFHQGLTPLIVPITLIKHYARKYETPYLRDQDYLNPHPAELKLRNHC
ncbi:MAG: DUF523 and DUF1722 domain-containing protein [Lentisphaeria bacterium]|nr:DUF523 and DUF1722 domain-containing protein [Lentisphaeria bacterium]